ncbi:MAG: hypothetical protein IPK60_01700 [Sandaracinaceae bacterium]|nr:hypothetical protein [Sandaracinaceae bacterium]
MKRAESHHSASLAAENDSSYQEAGAAGFLLFARGKHDTAPNDASLDFFLKSTINISHAQGAMGVVSGRRGMLASTRFAFC